MRYFWRLIPYVSLITLYGLLSGPAFGQISAGGTPWVNLVDLGESPLLDLSDHPTLRELEKKDRDAFGPLWAGVGIPIDEGLMTLATRSYIDQESYVWRMKIHAKDALAMGLVFGQFELVPGARLFIYDEDVSFVIGAFTSDNNNDHQVFSTHIIPGQTIVIELSEPIGPSLGRPVSTLHIQELIYIKNGGGLNLFADEKSLGSAGNCHVNINCPEGNFWQRQKRGIARILLREGSAWYWCSGTLMNNTREDGSPLFLTSDHCGEASSDADLAVWQFYFNYERPGCENTGTPPNNMLTGAAFRAKGLLSGGTDFKLLELHSTPPESYMPYYNGWSRSTTGSPSGVSIHHPSGDAKKISTYTSALTSANWNSGTSGMNQGFWRVSWAPTESGHGVTEGGSSGSPIFDHHGLVVGTLTGGASSCGGPTGPDFYGKFDRHWAANGTTPNRQLRPWLDPLGLDPQQLKGYDPYGNPYDPPLNLTAQVEGDEVSLSWLAPGTFVNPEGWIAYNTDLSHISWQGPQRATVFRASDFEFTYPANVTRLAHFFFEAAATHPWPDDTFKFFVYASDGETVLFESEVLKAEAGKLFTLILDEPIKVDGDFYVAVQPQDASGHPSTGMKLMEGVSAVNSYSGSPGSWVEYQSGDDYFEFYTMVYISASKSSTGAKNASIGQSVSDRRSPASAHEGIWIKAAPLDSDELILPSMPDNLWPDHRPGVQKIHGEAELSGYKIYRNDMLLATIDDPQQLSYSDTGLDPGDYSYFVTAMYNDDGESDESNKVFVTVEAPLVYYPVDFLIADQDGTPLEDVQITITPYIQEADELLYENWSGYGDFTTNLSPWKTLDPLEVETFYSQSFSFPGQTEPFAFMAFNPLTTTPPANHPAIDGDKYAIAISSAHEPTREEDKWLISPSVLLEGASSLSFYARSITASYGLERIRVLVSTGGNEREDFVHKITPNPYIEIPVTWTEFTFDLSQFAGQEIHFAIHYVSYDAFILMLDAIRVTGIGLKSNDSQIIFTDTDGRATTELLPGMYQYRLEKNNFASIRKVFTLTDTELVFEEQMSGPAFNLTLATDPADGGIAIDITDSNPYLEGAEVEVEALPAETHVFIGWTDGHAKEYLSTDLRYVFTMGAEDKVLTAHFEKDETSIIDRPGYQADWVVYPNPASTLLYIQMPAQQIIDAVLIYNLMGQLVSRTSHAGTSSASVDVSSLDNGMYILQVISQNQTHTRRIQINR